MGKSKKVQAGYNETGNRGGAQYLSPRNPQTGDGRTTRSIYDRIRSVIVRDSDGNKTGMMHGND